MAATHFDYDADGRKTHMHDSTGDTYWTYGDGVHLTQVTSPQGTVSYAYDSDGRRTTLTATGIGSWTTTFDPGGRVTSTKNPYNETTTLSYDAANRLIQKTKGNLNYEIYAYDVADQMTSVGYWWAGSILDRSLIYTYDPAGNVQSRNEGNRLINYGYDGADQQTAEVITGFAPMSIGYTYDSNGNRLTQTQNGSPYQSFTYDAHDKLTSGTGGNEIDGYDANGNETGISISGGFYTLTYDDEDRMTSITSSGGLNNTFIYNGLGLRVGKTDSSGTYSYLCDGTTPGSSVLSDGAAVYTPGQSEHRAGASNYPDFDSLGNILTIDAASGNVTQAGYLVTGFGTPEYTTGSSPTPFKYGGANGCQTDNDTGLILMGYRYYDTRIGRFISQDPAGAGNNWYAYAGNNPVILSDPLGLITKEDADAGGAAYASGKPGLYDFWQVTNGDYANAKYLYTKEVGYGNSLMSTALNGDIYLNFPGGSDFLNRRLQYANVEYQRTKPDIFGDPFVSAIIDADRIKKRANWFKFFVHGGGKWDIKNAVNATTDPDLHQLRENAGNFLYGAIGASLHFGEQTLLYGAGWAQFSDNGFVNAMSHVFTHFDDPEGQGEIEAGIAWYESGAHTYSIASP